jgi:hypothetical protein
MKGKDDPEAWNRLIAATKALKHTPDEQVDAVMASFMDVDVMLRFLALDVALANQDGYWKDGSDFNLYLDPRGRFSALPHDANEGFRSGGRSGGSGAPDPLVALDDTNKALRHRLLAVPALRARYLIYIRDIADRWLDWERLGPIVERYRSLIEEDVARDTRKLDSTESFRRGIYGADDGSQLSATTIKGFVELRRAALLSHPDVVRAGGG